MGNTDDDKLPAAMNTPMFRWFSPKQLSADAANILLSYALGDRNDFRLLEAATHEDGELEKRRIAAEQQLAERDECWIDYVADVGDGWNPTYAIACLLASDLSLDAEKENARLTLG